MEVDSGSSQLLSEAESAKFAGVSVETLNRYEQLGALVSLERSGQKVFDAKSVSELFGVELSGLEFPEVDAELLSEEESEELKANSLRDQIEIIKVDEANRVELDATELVRQLGINKQLREEISNLKDERDWLRQRLERLEEKGDRDQALMMSNLETIRSLTDVLKPKPSLFRRALPWLKDK